MTETKKLNQKNEQVSPRSKAAYKAWKTIRNNKKIFGGFKKPLSDFRFGVHIEPIPFCNGPCKEEQVLYYPSKKSMNKDIKKFQNDDQISGITVFEVVCMKANDF